MKYNLRDINQYIQTPVGNGYIFLSFQYKENHGMKLRKS